MPGNKRQRQEDEEAIAFPALRQQGTARKEFNKDVNQLGGLFAGERGTAEQGIIQQYSFGRMGYF